MQSALRKCKSLKMSFLGIDVGTTGCKAAAYNLEGQQISYAYREYPLVSPHPGWAELDPNVLWESVRSCISSIVSDVKKDPIQGVTLSALGEAILPISIDGSPLANCIVSFDNRSQHEYQHLMKRISAESIFNKTGLFVEPHYSIFKLMWWHKNQPEIYKNTWKFLCVGDYIGFKLGLRPVMDYSMATRTLCFNVHSSRWSESILDASGIDQTKLPEVASSGTIIGEISRDITRDMDIPTKTILVLGGLDQACAALGSKVIASGDTLLSVGTVAAIGPVFSSPTERMRDDRILSMPHVVPDVKITFGASIGGGSVLRWYRDQFGYEEQKIAQREHRNVYEVIIDQVQDEPTDLLVLPHFSGSRFAFTDPQSEAAITGLTFNSTKSDVIRALLEGVAYELAIIRDRFLHAGIPIHSFNASGGGSRSGKWMQIIADSSQVPIHTMQTSDAGTLGSALLTAYALGEFETLSVGARQFVKIRCNFEPRDEWRSYHSERKTKYKALYQKLSLDVSNLTDTDPITPSI